MKNNWLRGQQRELPDRRQSQMGALVAAPSRGDWAKQCHWQAPLLGVGCSWNTSVPWRATVPCGAPASLVLSSPRSGPCLPWGPPVPFWSIEATAIGLPLWAFAVGVAAAPPGRSTGTTPPRPPIVAVGIAEALVGECHSGDGHKL